MKLPPALAAAVEARAKALVALVVSGVATYIGIAVAKDQALTLHGLEVAAVTAFLSGVTVHQTVNKRRPVKAHYLGIDNGVRKAGNRGRLPVKPPADRFPIKYLHEYLTSPLPAPTYPIDVTGDIPDHAWGMLGNGPDPTCTTHPTGVGDCTFAGRQHNRMAKAAAAGLTETWETSNALVAEYLAYDHGKDEGANIADLLLAWYKAGVIAAFAPVDISTTANADAAMAAFHGLYSGVNLTDNADELFEQGKPWTVSASSQPDPDEGHCIVKVKADNRGTDGWVTWGALQLSTSVWTEACQEEGWVLITAEDAHLVDIAALRADIDALHGMGGAPAPTPAPVPTPTPAPTPTPSPSPVVADAADEQLAPVLLHQQTLASLSESADDAYSEWLIAKGLK